MLAADFEVSPVTADHALCQLARQGFVEVRGTAGRFVSPHPPHLHRFALVFPELGLLRSQFFTTLAEAAQHMAHDESPRRVDVYHNVSHHRDNEDHRRLLRHLRARMLAGVIFAWPNLSDYGSDLIDTEGVPAALVSTGVRPGVPTVYPDLQNWFDRAIAGLSGPGRRVASLQLPDPGGSIDMLSMLQRALDRSPHRTMPCWTQYTAAGGINTPRNASHAVQLLMQLPKENRPDALLVTDSALVQGTIQGLEQSGIEVGRDIEVIAHWNWPAPLPESPLPITWLGFDARTVLARLLDALQPAPSRTVATKQLVSAQFQHEVS